MNYVRLVCIFLIFCNSVCNVEGFFNSVNLPQFGQKRLYKLTKTTIPFTRLRMSDDDKTEENISYLEKINKKIKNQIENEPKTPYEKRKIEKLQSIKNNIEKYIIEKKKKEVVNDNKQPTFYSHYNNPAKKITFDKLFLNLKNIQGIFISCDYDRCVFTMNNGERFVYYVHNEQEKELINRIIKFSQETVKVVIICNKNIFTDTFGHLFCEGD